MTLQNDGYSFALSDEVTRILVRHRNRYGIEIADDLDQRKGLQESVASPASAIGPPHGGVKEQGSGVYAQALARRGFVALCFDPSHSRDRNNEQPFTRSSPLVIRRQAGITTARHRHASSYHRGVHR